MPVVVVPELPELVDVSLAHLNPGAVAEVPVLADDRKLQKSPHEVALAGLAIQEREVVLDVREPLALVLVEQEDRLR